MSEVIAEAADLERARKLLFLRPGVSAPAWIIERMAQGLAEARRPTESQVKHMVDRFLGWRLPEDFSPDAGISFKATFNEHTAHPMRHAPTGTNLFDARQAEAMVRYMLEGMPG